MKQSNKFRPSRGLTLSCAVFAASLSMLGGTAGAAADAAPVTAASLGLMQGFPPPLDKRVTRDVISWSTPTAAGPFSTSGSCNLPGISTAETVLPPAWLNGRWIWKNMSFDLPGDRKVDLASWLDASVTDAFLVAAQG